jgi:hypothetical protein
VKYLILMVSIISLAACTTTPSVQVGAEAEISFDGLHRVDNSKMKYAWVKPDLDLSGYNKLRLVAAGVEYRSVKPATRSSRANSTRDDFPMDAGQRARLEAAVREVFLEELGKSQHFTIVDDEGPDVLEVTGALLDVVSAIPPDTIGRGDYYLSKLGEATLVLEFRDSQSEEILARTVDRRAVEPVFVQRSARPFNTAEVKRELRRWATTLTERLDALHVLGNISST